MITTELNATLTGSDGPVNGVVKLLPNGAYHFVSIDDTLHITIAKDEEGQWKRIEGTEPYFSGWADELSEQIIRANTVI